MKPHITLVTPPYPSGSSQHPPCPSIGLGYLAAVLEKNQYKVDIIDYLTLGAVREDFRNRVNELKAHGFGLAVLMPGGVTYEDFRKEISKRQPDIVGITSTILTYKSALKIAKIAKEVNPKCLTILGGPHVTFWDEQTLQECAYVDVVVRKEGENTMLELAQRVEAGRDYSDALGITCRKNGKIVKNPDRPFIENLDDIPFPALHLWPVERLQKYGTVIFQILSSRGCVNWCNFCVEVRMHGRKYRIRSPKNVVDELEFLHKTYGAEYFAFLDDAFTVDQHRAAEICDEIRKRKLKIKWACETRVDRITKDLLLKMRESGCVAVWFGIESGSPTILEAMGKGISLSQTIRAFKWAKEVGLRANPNVILGFPGETKKTAWETIKFVRRLSPNHMGCYTVATPYPGTPMYDLVKKNGWLRVTDFDKYDTETPIIETPMLSIKELGRIYDHVFKKYYNHPTYVIRMYVKGGTYGFSATRTAFADLSTAIRFKLNRKSLPRDPTHA